MASQARLKNVQFKAASVINEKGNAINELETQVAEYQSKLQAALENHQKELAAKNEEADKLKADFVQRSAQAEETISRKNENINDLETRSKENSERFDSTLKKKNADLAEMGEELRRTTERLAKLLKKQESLESESFARQARIESLERQLQGLKNDRTRMETQLKATKDKPASLD